MTSWPDPTTSSPTLNLGSRGDIVTSFPDWAGRQLLAEALRAVGLPVVWGAAWRRPADRWMTHEERLLAIELEARVVAEARRMLPPGVSGAAIGDAWRAMSWGCTVAAVAVLDADARERLLDADDDEDEVWVPAAAVIGYAAAGGGAVGTFASWSGIGAWKAAGHDKAELSAEPLVIRRRDAASTSTTSPSPTVLFRRRGEVQRAS